MFIPDGGTPTLLVPEKERRGQYNNKCRPRVHGIGHHSQNIQTYTNYSKNVHNYEEIPIKCRRNNRIVHYSFH